MKIYDETLALSIYEMHDVRSDIRTMLSIPEPIDGETHGEFESAIADVIDEIRPHVVGGDVPELAKLWQQYNIEYIAEFESRTMRRKKSSKNQYGIPQNSEVREIRRFDMRTLLSVSQLLDRIAKQLGLMPETKRGGRTSGRLS